MSVEVAVRQHGDVVVVRMSGTAGDELVAHLADGMAAVAEAAAGLVVELHDFVLADVLAVRTLAHRLLTLPADRVAVSCGRLSGRRLLRQCGGSRLEVFTTTEDALVALRAGELQQTA